MSGDTTDKNQSRGAQRAQLLHERDENIIRFMQAQRPVAAIAEFEGLAHDYCAKLCRRLADANGIDYNPERTRVPTTTLGKLSEQLRGKLGGYLKDLKQSHHSLEITRELGLKQMEQKRAEVRPYNHNWTLAQMERLAQLRGETLTDLLVNALFVEKVGFPSAG
jgi:hypothetical protein